MKYLIKIKYQLLVMLLIIGFGSCTKNFEEINKDPNNPVDVPAINIFTNALESSIDRQLGGWIQHTYLGPWSQQWTKVMYIDEDKYMPRDMSGDFDGPYSADLKNLQIIIDKTTANGDDRLLAAAKIMRVWVFMHLTDMFGDIPYSEALQGFSEDGTLTPVYDTQESIYTACLAELEEANVFLTGTTLNFGAGDIVYGGDPVKWRKFANSLKLRLLNRAAGTPWTFTYNMAGTQTDVTTSPGAAALSTADAQIAAILANPSQYPVFESNDDNMMLVYPGLPYRNPIYNTLYSRTDQGISETTVNWLKARNDPRIHIYAQPTPLSQTTPPANYNGFQNGRGINSAPFPQISLLGTKVAYTEKAPTYVMTYDEVEFIKAEYYMRAANDADAKTAYENGIVASMGKWGLADGSTVSPTYGKLTISTMTESYPVNFATYLANPLVSWGGTNAEKFQKICEQRWASMFGQGVQAWHEVRRTGFPARIFEYELEGAYYPNLGMPVRVQYSTSEETYNTNNLTAARTRQNIEQSNEGMFSTNGISSQMWWNTRKNPIPTEIDPPLK